MLAQRLPSHTIEATISKPKSFVDSVVKYKNLTDFAELAHNIPILFTNFSMNAMLNILREYGIENSQMSIAREFASLNQYPQELKSLLIRVEQTFSASKIVARFGYDFDDNDKPLCTLYITDIKGESDEEIVERFITLKHEMWDKYENLSDNLFLSL